MLSKLLYGVMLATLLAVTGSAHAWPDDTEPRQALAVMVEKFMGIFS